MRFYYGIFKRKHTTGVRTNKKEADKIKQIMESTVTLEVPNKVDYEEGANWGNIK